MAQFGVGAHPDGGTLLQPLFVIAISAGVGGALLIVLGWLVPRARRALRAGFSRRRRLIAAANAERRARAMMDELCPHGWQGQIVLLADRVVLDWTELDEGGSRPAVSRRVIAPTINEALEVMVADRRTDETLQQIEQGALADGAIWPDR